MLRPVGKSIPFFGQSAQYNVRVRYQPRSAHLAEHSKEGASIYMVLINHWGPRAHTRTFVSAFVDRQFLYSAFRCGPQSKCTPTTDSRNLPLLETFVHFTAAYQLQAQAPRRVQKKYIYIMSRAQTTTTQKYIINKRSGIEVGNRVSELVEYYCGSTYFFSLVGTRRPSIKTASE